MDDDASVAQSYGAYRVVPLGGDPHDEELLRAAEAVDAPEEQPRRSWAEALRLGAAPLW